MLQPRTWIFESRTNHHVKYTVMNGSDGLWCDCPGFQHRESCWHVQKAYGQLEYERMRAKAVEINRIRTGRSVFEEMVKDREAIYKELERKRVLYAELIDFR